MGTASQKSIGEIRKAAMPIPGRTWLFHPAVPVGLITRHPTAQRASTLTNLKNKNEGRGFDADMAGVPRLCPNGSKFYAVTGATRTEWASEVGEPTMPAEIWPDEMPVKEMAEKFLHETVNTPPNICTTQRLGVLAEERIALAVKEAQEELRPTVIVGAFRSIYRKKNGPALLKKTVAALKKMWPRNIKEISAPVVSGMALLLLSGGTPATKWRRLGPKMLLERARLRQASFGGKGNLPSHVAALLKGAR